MDALRQRLKELDSSKFQDLCFHILDAKHPGLKLKNVEGAGGDKGLDIFAGQLDGRFTTWQCKSFPNGVGKPQKKQIRHSLETALKHFSPQGWILCISVDLNTDSYRWFEKLKSSYSSKLRIGLFSASEIISQLLHRKAIRTHFFPDLGLDVMAMKQIFSKADDLNLEELEVRAETDVEDILERWKEKDPRCDYQLIYESDTEPDARRQTGQPGLMLSISSGAKTLNVFARDIEALQSNPPSFKISLTASGAEKIRELIKTGARQEFSAEEIINVTSDWPVVASLVQKWDPANGRIVAGPPHLLTSRMRSVRVTFRKRGGESIVYDLMTARPARLGAEEAEIVCSGRDVPFEIGVVFPTRMLGTKSPDKVQIQSGGRVTFHKRPIGSSFVALNKFLDALSLLRPAGDIDILDLEQGKLLFRAECELGEEELLRDDYRRFVNKLARIAEQFKVDLRVPPSISEEDGASIRFLDTLIDGGTLPLDDISATLLKSDENKNLVPTVLAEGRGLFRITNERHKPPLVMFGVKVDSGPFAIECEANIRRHSELIEEFELAAIGDGIRISFEPIGPARFYRISEGELLGPNLAVRGPTSNTDPASL